MKSFIRTKTLDNLMFEDVRWRVTAEYGINVLGKQNPYFTLTGSAWELRKGRRLRVDDPDLGGQITDLILAAFPWLTTMRTAHLCDAVTGEKLHALENSWYWFTNTEKDDLVWPKLGQTYSMSDPTASPLSWKDLSPSERAANYLGCTPALFAEVEQQLTAIRRSTHDDPDAIRQLKAEYSDVVDTLRPSWMQMAAATVEMYQLEEAFS